MANVKVKWVLPDTRESGKPLNIVDIDYVEVEVSADGETFVSIGQFKPHILECDVTDLDFGEWTFRGVVMDVRGRPSAPMIAFFTNEDVSPPSSLKVFEVVLQ